MENSQVSIVMYGRDAHLLETREWILKSLGYRVVTILCLAELDRIPLAPPVALLVLCHPLSFKECEDALAHASSRWHGIQKLDLMHEGSKSRTEIHSRLRQTLDVPAGLLTRVSNLVGYAGSSSYSHTY